MKSILVPTDFSPCAANALNYAAGLALRINAKIDLLHVYHIPVPPTDIPYVAIEEQDNGAVWKEKLNSIVQVMKQKYPSVSIDPSITMDFALEGIAAKAKQFNSDLIVMGQRGKTTFSDRIFGSTATAMINRSACPVCIVPEVAPFTNIENIAVACDFKHRKDESKIKVVKKIADLLNAKIWLFSIINEEEEFNPEKAMESDYMQDLLGTTSFSIHYPFNNDVHDGILNFVKEHPIQMLTMFPHHHNFFEQLFVRLNSENIAMQVHVPILLINEHVHE
jgi:nucleotide-binding universal stress UspA family protein